MKVRMASDLSAAAEEREPITERDDFSPRALRNLGARPRQEKIVQERVVSVDFTEEPEDTETIDGETYTIIDEEPVPGVKIQSFK